MKLYFRALGITSVLLAKIQAAELALIFNDGAVLQAGLPAEPGQLDLPKAAQP